VTRPVRTTFAAILTASAVVWLEARQQPTFRRATNVVSIYATVVDRTGRLVPGLAEGDFDVLDNGVRQRLSLFANDVQPITIVIMLDRSGSMTSNFTLERDAAEAFVNALLPGDRARLGSFSNRVEIDPPAFTSDKPTLARILHEDLQEGGPTPLWNATSAAMNALDSQPGRRVVLVFTDGEDNPFRLGSNVTLPEVRQRGVAEEIMVYAIGLADPCAPGEAAGVAASGASPRWQRGRPGGPPPVPLPLPGRVPGGPGGLPPGDGRIGVHPPDPGPLVSPHRPLEVPCSATQPDPGLRTLADEGGGAYVELRPTDDLAAAFARVADELHRQYLLGFVPTALDGKTHVIEVRVHRPDLTARARRSYVAGAGSH